MFSEVVDARLNMNKILERLLDIFNTNKDEGDNFVGNINYDEITIRNNGLVMF